ncbi:MAG: sugar ABC transporter substrate-binding protein [Prevotella sp.]|jgi:ABC-type sugar transport system substrate-binding protein|nr:sugar ABC transporter substrate-binding protein [Prevotella sp.]
MNGEKGIAKLFTVVICVLCLLFSVVACSKQTPVDSESSSNEVSSSEEEPAEDEVSSSDETSKDAEGLILGIALNVMDDYQNRQLNAFTEAAAARGAEIVSTSANGNIDQQISDVESLVTRGVDGILVNALDKDGLVPAVEAAVEAGIPVIEGGYGINSTLVYSVGTRQAHHGELQYEYIADYLEANPEANLNICYLWGYGPTKSGDLARHDAFFELLEKNYPDRYTVLAEKYTDYVVETAISAVEDWYTAFPEMNTLICQNDEMAVAAINILEAHGVDMDGIIICGIDGSQAISETYLEAGTLDMTTYTDLNMACSIKLDYLIQLAKGELQMTENFYVDDAQSLVTPENYADIF